MLAQIDGRDFKFSYNVAESNLVIHPTIGGIPVKEYHN
jgi:hypothetical protein